MERKCKCGCNEKDEKLEKILSKYEKDKSELIQILNEVQEIYGYIPQNIQIRVAEYLGLTPSEVYGVVTFYSRFTLKPKGKYNIAVCIGTACYVKGSEKILSRLKERLNIDVGQTTSDGTFSIEATRCVGACGLAPVFTINDEVYGHATIKMLDEILDKYLGK